MDKLYSGELDLANSDVVRAGLIFTCSNCEIKTHC
jgi:hypothetical protein